MDERQRAQRWHDTDHGPDRKPPGRSPFRVVLPEEPPLRRLSACWCCCTLCDPDSGKRWNPFWHRAEAELTQASGQPRS